MTIRVVIAEDDPQIAEIQQRYVAKIKGFELVGVAHNLWSTHDLVEVLQPDLLLLDIYFPDGTGLEFLKQLRANNNATDVILITAAKDVDTLREAMHNGVYHFLIKPLVFDRLKEVLLNYQLQHNKLSQLDQLAQDDIDTILKKPASIHTPTVTQRLPKGVDGITLNKVRQAFINNSTTRFSAEEMGTIIGASRTTARRYLEFLTSTQEITAEVSYGSVGRPERRYQKVHQR